MDTKKIFTSEVFVTIAIMAISLFLYSVFRVNGDFQEIIMTISFLLAIPALYIRLILKKSLRKFGLQVGDWKKGLVYSGISMVIMAVIFAVLFIKFNFAEKYRLPAEVFESFRYFIYYEAVIAVFYYALHEFFFRGFVMFYFSDKIKSGAYANGIQIVSFCLFVYFVSSFSWATLPYVLLAPLAGVIAIKSKSIIYSFAFSWVTMLVIDSIFVKIILDKVLR